VQAPISSEHVIKNVLVGTMPSENRGSKDLRIAMGFEWSRSERLSVSAQSGNRLHVLTNKRKYRVYNATVHHGLETPIMLPRSEVFSEPQKTSYTPVFNWLFTY
jgi:hypothetical protein